MSTPSGNEHELSQAVLTPLPSLLVRAAASPNETAFFFAGEAHSWGRLAAEAQRLGPKLRALVAVQRSAPYRVAVCASNRPETVTVLFSLMELGATLVLLHPRSTEDERKADAAASGAVALIDDATVDEWLSLATDDSEGGRPFAATTWRAARNDPSLKAASLRVPNPPGSEDFVVLFTSGSTGQKKAVRLSWAAFAAAAKQSRERLGFLADDQWLLCLPLCHIGGLSIIIRCYLAARPFVLLPRFEPQAVLEQVRLGAVSMASFVPTMLYRLLPLDTANVLANLRVMLVGGAHTPVAIVDECAQRGLALRTTYGLTEACSQVTTQAFRPRGVVEYGVGAALPPTKVTIVDPGGQPVADGVEGRIHIEGPTLMTGYDGHADVFGRYLTADIGVIDSAGCLRVLGRADDVIISGGENIHPQEVEDALLVVDGVKEAVVFSAPDAEWGECVACVLVLGPGADESQVLQALRQQLATFKCPKLVVSFASPFSLHEGGKISRKRIREVYLRQCHPVGP